MNTSISFKFDHCHFVCLKANHRYSISLDLDPKMSAGKSQKSKPFPATPIPINIITFSLLAAKPDHQVFSMSLRDIEHALKLKPCVNSATVLPSQYHKFLNIFSKDEVDKLPPHCLEVDYEIKIKLEI